MGWPWSVRQCDCAWCIPNRTEFGVIGGQRPRAGIADADTDGKVWKSGRGSGSRNSSCFRCSQLYHWFCSDCRRRLFGERGESVTRGFISVEHAPLPARLNNEEGQIFRNGSNGVSRVLQVTFYRCKQSLSASRCLINY